MADFRERIVSEILFVLQPNRDIHIFWFQIYLQKYH